MWFNVVVDVKHIIAKNERDLKMRFVILCFDVVFSGLFAMELLKTGT